MNRTKCVNCGFVSWATAETCKKCGAQLSEFDQVESLSQSTEPYDPIESPGRGKRVRILFAIFVLVALAGGLLAFKPAGSDQPQEFVLKDGSKKSSKAWFRSWFSSDPTVDEIVAHYLKVSGWEANPSALKNFVGKGRFQIKNVGGETLAETMGTYRYVVHFHWDSCDGEIEFEAEGPDKFVISQKYDNPVLWQRGTNGKKAWTRKAYPDKSTEVSPHMPLIATYGIGDLNPDRLTDVKRGADFINYFLLPNKYERLYLNGKTMVGDRVAYQVSNRTWNDAMSEMFFDVETGMLLMFTSYRYQEPYLPLFDGYYVRSNGSSVWAETYLDDYREVNGVKLPFLVRQHINQVWITTQVTDFKANVTIDPSVFEKPAS